MPLILGTNSIKETGYEVANSCRFDQASSSYMNKTYGSGNRRKFTFSTWIKRCNPSSRTIMYNCYVNSTNYEAFFLHEDGYLEFDAYHGSQIWRYKSNALFRDPSAFYHFMFAVDTEHDTASSRVRLYVNGSEITSFSTETNPSENYDMMTNESGKVVYLGRKENGSSASNMYLAETVFIDGSQLTPSSFGEYDSDTPTLWKPIDVSELTFGTNGFYLDYEDSSNLGNDANGGTDLTEVNLATTDQSTDTCTNNFCTMNPLVPTSNVTFSEGNLKIVTDSSSSMGGSGIGTFGLNAGKWYWEVKIASLVANHNHGVISENTSELYTGATAMQNDTGVTCWRNDDGGEMVVDGSPTSNDYGLFTDGQIMGIALDMDNYNISIYRNGSALVSDFNMSTTRGTIFPFINTGINTTSEVNFGGTQSFTVSSGNSDGNGYGNFEYAVPSGYFALCTKNLAEYG